MNALQDKLITLVADYATRGVVVKPESDLQNDLNLDSLDVLEFTMSIENEFKIEIDDDVFDRWNTFQDVVDTVASLVNRQAA